MQTAAAHSTRTIHSNSGRHTAYLQLTGQLPVCWNGPDHLDVAQAQPPLCATGACHMPIVL